MLLILIHFFSKDSFIISLINIPIYLISFLYSIYELDYLIIFIRIYEYKFISGIWIITDDINKNYEIFLYLSIFKS